MTDLMAKQLNLEGEDRKLVEGVLADLDAQIYLYENDGEEKCVTIAWFSDPSVGIQGGPIVEITYGGITKCVPYSEVVEPFDEDVREKFLEEFRRATDLIHMRLFKAELGLVD